MDERWYSVTLIIRSRQADHVQDEFLLDEQVHVLRAPDNQTAYEKALALGKSEEESYRAADGGTVFWEFVGISELDLIMDDDITDGTEIRSRLFHYSNPDQLIQARAELLNERDAE